MNTEDTAEEVKKPEVVASAPEAEVPAETNNALSGAIQTTGIAAVALSILGAILQGPAWAVGTAIGGVLATLNLVIFARVAAAFIAQKGRSAPWAVIGGLKLMGLFACVYIILSRGDISALAFVLGYGALPIGISISSLRAPR
jgi:hypothetical protein